MMLETLRPWFDWAVSLLDDFVIVSGVAAVFGTWLASAILRKNTLSKKRDPLVRNTPRLFELGELATEAYDEPDLPRKKSLLKRGGISEAQGWTREHVEDATLALSAYVYTNEKLKCQIVAFRGTITEHTVLTSQGRSKPVKTTANVKTDADVMKVSAPGIGKLHRGFYRASLALYDKVRALLKPSPGWHTDLTGHSLGGAMAVVTAMLLTRDSVKVEHVVTFGQPKVGNKLTATKWCDKLRLIRVVNDKDLVPLVPFGWPWNAALGRSFWHFGTELHIENDGDGVCEFSPYRARASGNESIYSQLLSRRRNILRPFHEAGDHRMTSYLAVLKPLLPDGAYDAYDTSPN